MTAVSAPRQGWELLAGQVNQRRYEALRAYLFQGASLQQAAYASGYTRDALASYEAEHGEITDDEMRDAARRARERAIVVRGDPERRSSGPAQHGRGAA
jgi:hypothetical protein